MSIVGEIMLISDGSNLTDLYIKGQDGFDCDGLIMKEDLEIFRIVCNWLDDYFRGENPTINFHIKLEGSEFKKEVWNILRDIPYGKVISYKDVTMKMKSGNKAFQAVGSAVGKNPISIIVPCHRVIGSNFKIGGYNGGIDLKRKLLEIEGIEVRDMEVIIKENK